MCLGVSCCGGGAGRLEPKMLRPVRRGVVRWYLVASALVVLVGCAQRRTPCVYEFPAGYRGWVYRLLPERGQASPPIRDFLRRHGARAKERARKPVANRQVTGRVRTSTWVGA